jgi:hypothetical protein
MSPCGSDPRLGTEPKLGENDKVSEVRFNSRMLSEPVTGVGSGVGVLLLFGRKIVLKPLPFQVPTKAAKGPRLGGTMGTGGGAGAASAGLIGAIGSEGTSPNKKSFGREIFALGLIGPLIWSEHPRFGTGRLYVE